MSITRIDIDDETLGKARRLMGTTTKEDTVNVALREYVARVERLEALDRLAARARRGEFDEAEAAHHAAKAAQKDAVR
ncbi:type II toxin-antitoxin system VapB family antitoxin [Nonomuraea sp. NPDC059194]|uniref:type II toxin-antitoxin system VapB family antitoxin n=1 Tax=Nonomuraea sp. NPDC059194 TaxID=3346764 RepID=UPI0036B4EF41